MSGANVVSANGISDMMCKLVIDFNGTVTSPMDFVEIVIASDCILMTSPFKMRSSVV